MVLVTINKLKLIEKKSTFIYYFVFSSILKYINFYFTIIYFIKRLSFSSDVETK